MSELDQVNPIPLEEGLTQRAYAEIRRAILGGRLEAGSMTSVRALSEALGISRTPVREALVGLAKERLVSFERNRGVRICIQQRRDVVEIFELRLLLEVPSVRRAIEPESTLDLGTLEEQLEAMKAHLDDETSFMRHDWLFHRALLTPTGNERLVAFVESLRNQARTRGISTVGRSRPLGAIVAEHEAIYAAARARDADAGASAMAAHLQSTRDLLLAQEDEPLPASPQTQEEP